MASGVMKLLRVVDINFDVMEMIVEVINGSHKETQHIGYDKLLRFRFGRVQVRKWFRNKERKVIEMHLRDRNEPLILMESDLKSSFPQIEEYVRSLAQKNKLPIEE